MDLHADKRAYMENGWWRKGIVNLPIGIRPGHRALFSTQEVVTIPKDAFGLIHIRSTWARKGLFCPATIADPGFNGTLTLEVLNGSTQYIEVKKGDSLWSLNLVPTWGEIEPYNGKYQNQMGLTLAKED